MLKKCLALLLVTSLIWFAPAKANNDSYQISKQELDQAVDFLKKLIADGHSEEEITQMMQDAMEKGAENFTGTVIVSPNPTISKKNKLKYYIIGAGIGLGVIALLAGGYYAYNSYEQSKKEEADRLAKEAEQKAKEEAARLQQEGQQPQNQDDKNSSTLKPEVIEVVVENAGNLTEKIKDEIEGKIKKKKHKHKHKHHKENNEAQATINQEPEIQNTNTVNNNIAQPVTLDEKIEGLESLVKIKEKGVVKQKAKELFGKLQHALNIE